MENKFQKTMRIVVSNLAGISVFFLIISLSNILIGKDVFDMVLIPFTILLVGMGVLDYRIIKGVS